MTTADEALRKLLAAPAPRRTTTAAAPTPIDDEGAAAAARAELRRQRPASRTDAPAETLESALSQGSARALAAALARMPASGAATEAQRADCRKLLALRPLPLDRYAAALAAAAERERDAAYRRARARLRFVDGGEATGPDEFDATRIGARAACSQLRAPRKRDVAAGRARYYFEASLRSAGAAGTSANSANSSSAASRWWIGGARAALGASGAFSTCCGPASMSRP